MHHIAITVDSRNPDHPMHDEYQRLMSAWRKILLHFAVAKIKPKTITLTAIFERKLHHTISEFVYTFEVTE